MAANAQAIVLDRLFVHLSNCSISVIIQKISIHCTKKTMAYNMQLSSGFLDLLSMQVTRTHKLTRNKNARLQDTFSLTISFQ